MSATTPAKGEGDAAKGSEVKASESEASIQIQNVDAEAVSEAVTGDKTEAPPASADGAAAAATPADEATAADPAPPSEKPTEPEAEKAPADKPSADETPADAAPTEEQEGVPEAEGEEGDAAEDADDGGADGAEGAADAPPTPGSATSGDGKPRATRSRNPAFAAKQKNFIKDYKKNVGAPAAGEKRSGGGGGGEETKKRRKSDELPAGTAGGVALNDNFCWVCHREGKVVCCETCPRVFHLKCAQLTADPPGDWVCVECRRVVQAETVDNLSPAMKMLTHEQFTLLLKHAIGRLKGLPGAEPFITPVDESKFPNYGEFVSCPMDLNTMEENIQRGQYGSTEAFIADCKWILHNCILFNGQTSKLTALARSLLRMCKWEMDEIETCPDCYSNAYLSDDWFTLACPHPHMLIWARLKGFPYWPAKAVKCRDGNVDCRFFGRHDRAWVPIKECYLFSKEPPSPPKNRSKSLDACIEELEEHIRNLEEKFGKFVHAKFRTVYDPRKIGVHIKQMLPNYECNIVRPDQEVPKRKRSGSDLQLDKLEKLRQQKKARRSVPSSSPGASGGGGGGGGDGEKPGPGAPGGPPELRAQGEEEDMGEPDEDMEEMMEEVEDDEDDPDAMEEGTPSATPTATPKAAKPQRKSQGKTPSAAAGTGAAASPATKPAAATPAKPAAAAKAGTPAAATVKTTAAASPAPADAKAKAAATAAAEAKLASKTSDPKPVAKAVDPKTVVTKVEPNTGTPVVQKVHRSAPAAATPVRAAQGGVQPRMVKPPAGGSPAGLVTRPAVLQRAPQQRARNSPVPVRANGLGTMSPGQRPSRLPMHQQHNQQRTPSAATAARAAAAATGVSQDTAFVVSTPSRIGPMMIVPGSAGGAVSNGTGVVTGPAEGATAAQAPPPPTHTGAVGEQLRTQANDLSEMMRTGLEEALNELAQGGAAAAPLASLRLQLERLQWRHQMELSEQKKVTDTMLAELRSSMEIEQKKTVNKLTAAFAAERGEWSRLTELRVSETKRKQWCATCGREAIFYCCWNTSYCDFPCQEAQWPKHMLTCANQQSGGGQPAAAEETDDAEQHGEIQEVEPQAAS